MSTAEELKAAIDAGIAHVEITQHLDLRGLPVFNDDKYGNFHPLYTPPAPFVNISALESISVRRLAGIPLEMRMRNCLREEATCSCAACTNARSTHTCVSDACFAYCQSPERSDS